MNILYSPFKFDSTIFFLPNWRCFCCWECCISTCMLRCYTRTHSRLGLALTAQIERCLKIPPVSQKIIYQKTIFSLVIWQHQVLFYQICVAFAVGYVVYQHVCFIPTCMLYAVLFHQDALAWPRSSTLRNDPTCATNKSFLHIYLDCVRVIYADQHHLRILPRVATNFRLKVS